MEIGSEFWIDQKPTKWENKAPVWLEKFGDIILTASGRGAIKLLLQQIRPPYKTALLPAYICESVIMPFVEEDYTCFFYDIKQDLFPDIEKILQFERIGVFLYMGYFGYPVKNMLEVLNYFKSESAIIVEDVTHTLFSDYEIYDINDFCIGSIRKWFGVPTGGFLSSNNFKIDKPRYNNLKFSQKRKEALLLKAEYIENSKKEIKEKAQYKFSAAEEIIDNDVNPYLIDFFSLQLINNLNSSELIRKRRDNFIFLLQEMGEIDFIHILLPYLEENICPLFFPVLVKNDREWLKAKLIEEKIYCPVHWPIPKQIDAKLYPNSSILYDSELSIPCDQRYGINEMGRIINVLKALKKRII